MEHVIRPIARMRSDFSGKFGITPPGGDSAGAGEPHRPLSRSTGSPSPCGAWRASATCGSSGSFRRTCARTGPPRCARPRLGGKPAPGGLCHPFPLPAQRSGPQLRGAAGAGGAAGPGPDAESGRGGPDGRHPHFRYKALCALCRLQKGGQGRLCPGRRGEIEKWSGPRVRRTSCRKTSWRPSPPSWPGTPGPNISMIRSASMPWTLPAIPSASPWRGRSSRSGRRSLYSPEGKAREKIRNSPAKKGERLCYMVK